MLVSSGDTGVILPAPEERCEHSLESRQLSLPGGSDLSLLVSKANGYIRKVDLHQDVDNETCFMASRQTGTSGLVLSTLAWQLAGNRAWHALP